MHFSDLQNKKILLLGFGREGVSNFQMIRKNFPGTSIAVADAKSETQFSPEEQKILSEIPLSEKFLGPQYLSVLKNFELVIKSPGVLWTEEMFALSREGRLTSATKIFFETIGREKIIGITGTKGKSTTATLLWNVLKNAGKSVHLLGNVGKPAMDYIDQKNPDALFVYELSSYQLQDLDQSPHIAIWTSFFPQHLKYHHTMNVYFEAKTNIVRYQNVDDIFIYNAKYHEYFKEIEDIIPSKKISYNREDSYHWLKYFVYRDNEKLFALPEIKLLGEHNRENILAVIAASKELEVKDDILLETIKNFEALPHRLEFIGRRRGIDFYNDSISTGPEATLPALRVFGERLGTIILGGVDNADDFSSLLKCLFEYKVQNIILLGANRKRIYEELLRQKKFYEKENLYTPYVFFIEEESDSRKAMGEVVEKVYECTPEGKICLLSPSSQSYGLFKNFEERGDLFRKYVEELQ